MVSAELLTPIFAVIYAAITFIAAPLALLPLLKRLMSTPAMAGMEAGANGGFASRSLNSLAPLDLLALSMTFGPLCVALMTGLSYALGQPCGRTVTTIGVSAIVVFGAVSNIRQTRSLMAAIPGALRDSWPKGPWHGLILAMAVGCVALVLIETMAAPLLEHDALEYHVYARHLFQNGSLAAYPGSVADPITGFYQTSTHPPGFLLSQIWGLHFVGSGSSLALRVFQVGNILALVVLMRQLAWRITPGSGALAVLLLFSVPLFSRMASTGGIDGFRITLALGALLAQALYVELPSRMRASLAGICAAAALTAHALALPLVGLFLLITLVRTFPWGKPRLIELGIMIGASGVGLLIFFMPVALRYGTLLADGHSGLVEPTASIQADLLVRRGFDLASARWFDGVFRPWTAPAEFGLVFWGGSLVLLAVLWRLALRWRHAVPSFSGRPTADQPAQESTPSRCGQTIASNHSGYSFGVPPSSALTPHALVLLGFFGMVIVSVLMGSAEAVKNPRYLMTLAPFAALVCVWGLLVLLPPVLRVVAMVVLALPLLATLFGHVVGLWGLADPVGIVVGREDGVIARERYAFGHAMKALRQPGREAGAILTFRQPDSVAYGRHRGVDQHDPRLAPLYTAREPRVALETLKELDIRYVLTSWHGALGLNRTALMPVLGDPRSALLISDYRNVRLYALTGLLPDASCRGTELYPDRVLHEQKTTMYWSSAARQTGLSWLAARDPLEITTISPNDHSAGLVWKKPDEARLIFRFAIPARTAPARVKLVWQAQGRGLHVITAGGHGAGQTSLLFDGLADQRFAPMAQFQLAADSNQIEIIVTGAGSQGGDLQLSGMRACLLSVEPP